MKHQDYCSNINTDDNSHSNSYILFFIGPSSEYVISLKAFNNVGEGVPIYETTVTREESSKYDC